MPNTGKSCAVDRPVARTSGEWTDYFQVNRQSLAPMPNPADHLPDHERQLIAKSIAEFQLGESSEGKHLIRAAKAYAKRHSDPDYVVAIGLFIAEENRHARDLGRFMDSHGIERNRRTIADAIFRQLRRLAGLDTSISVLVTAEIIAQVYYRALRDATGSPVLKALCRQILRDEKAHVQFQCERLAIIRRKRGAAFNLWSRTLHRLLMIGAILVVWHNHGPVLRGARFSFRGFTRNTLRYAERAFRIALPGRYSWPDAAVAAAPEHSWNAQQPVA
ncbi:MAG: ferritin-like domain-containing protein [Phycisphaerales bacterium]|nr:ferritin-like domain-containing protein [Phycisphaerales bacterium]